MCESQDRQRGSHPRRQFTKEEDAVLTRLVAQYPGDWYEIANQMPDRNVRQCRERWKKYLDPNLKNDSWTDEEDSLLLQKYDEFGTKWKEIAKFFPDKTDIGVKNRYYRNIRHQKKIYEKQHGIIRRRISKKMRLQMEIEKEKEENNSIENDFVPDSEDDHEYDQSKSLEFIFSQELDFCGYGFVEDVFEL